MWQLLLKIAPGLAALTEYKPSWFKSDLAAGLSVAAVALPVGIAYADLAGVPAVIGMYSAIFPLFAYALFGSSRQLMTGPDAATCIIVAASLAHLAAGDAVKYQALMVVLTLCTGLVYIVAGFLKLGFIANFLSLPILIGFLNGIAIIIIVGQLQKLFGYTVDDGEFFSQLSAFIQNLDHTHLPTLVLGVALLVVMVVLKRFFPRLPSALLVVILGIGLVEFMKLDQQGISVLGAVPAGMPSLFSAPDLGFKVFKEIMGDAVALTLVSFTSGILTAKSFAQRNNYEVDANQELIGFGACNIASGLVQGFPVTGADSRTAVNNAMGGKTQLVGIVAGIAMLIVLFFFTSPLASVPIAALAAVIIVSAVGLFDLTTLKELYQMNRLEFVMSLITTCGVLVLGALPGVMLAVILSMLLLLAINSKPPSAVLGRVEELKSFQDIRDWPNAQVLPGLLLYRFEANIVFFNVDYFKKDLLDKIKGAATPVEWVVIDASSVNVIDSTAVRKFDDLREQLRSMGMVLYIANQKSTIQRFFQLAWVEGRSIEVRSNKFASLKQAVKSYKRYKKSLEDPVKIKCENQ